MTISKVICGTSTGTAVATAINALIDTLGNTSRTNTVTIFGDSFTAYQRFSDLATNHYQQSVIQASCWSFLLAELGDAVDVTQYAGVGGDQASDMLTRIQTDVLDNPTDWVFGQVGVNDFYGFARTGQAVFDDVESMINSCISNGSKVLWLNCYPQPSTRGGYTKAKAIELSNYNKLLADYAKTKDGLILVDVHSPAVDFDDDAFGAALPTWFIGTDKVHLGIYGAWATAQLCLTALSPYMVPTSHRKDVSPLTTGDYGGITQCNFGGGTGTASTDASGNVPDLWVLKRQSGAGTVVGSILPATGDYQMAINNTSGSSVYRLSTFDMNASFAGGETVQSRLVLELDLGSLELEELRAYFYVDNSVDDFYSVDWGRSINGYTPNPMPVGEIALDIAPALVWDAPLTDVNFFIDIRVTGAATGNVILKSLRIIDTPA